MDIIVEILLVTVVIWSRVYIHWLVIGLVIMSLILLMMIRLPNNTPTNPPMLPQQIQRIHTPTPRTLNLPILTIPHMLLQFSNQHLFPTKDTHSRGGGIVIGGGVGLDWWF